jgi:hypothetical protein
MAARRSRTGVAGRLPIVVQLQSACAHRRADARRRVIPLTRVSRASEEARVTTGVTLTLLGFGLGAMIMASQSSSPRARMTLRDRAIAAQEDAARAAKRARDLTARWNEES